MSLVETIDLSKPFENFAVERGKLLFEWAEQTWRGFLKQILQVMEGDDITDQDFAMLCNQLARVHSAQYPNKHAEMLKDWALLVELPLTSVKAWEVGQSLPEIAEREAIVRQMLERLVKHIRTVNAKVFLATMVYLVNLQDLRKPNVSMSVSPSTYKRSVHRLGFEQKISDILFAHNLKTVGDLKRYIEPPPQGGFRVSSRHSISRKEFDPVEKLQKLQGIDKVAAKAIIKATNQWDGGWSPSQLLV